MSAIDDAVAELYSAPPTEFTDVRARLVRELREHGERNAADELRARRKPTLAAWAVNQLAHENGDDVERLIALGRELADAPADRERLRDANRELRELVTQLRERAAAALEQLGRDPAGHVDDIEQTLTAAAVSEDGRGRVLRGELVKPLPAPGFSALADMPPASGPDEPADRRRRRRRERQVRQLERHVETLERQQHDDEQRVERLQAQLEDAQATAASRRSRAARARAELAEARAELEEDQR